MEELIEQIEHAIQIYFDKSGIKEDARVAIFKKQPMLWEVSVYTDSPLSIDTMHTVHGLVYLSVPIGVMHEVINKQYQLLSESAEVQPGPHPGVTRGFANINTSDDVMMPGRTVVESVINQNGSQMRNKKKR